MRAGIAVCALLALTLAGLCRGQASAAEVAGFRNAPKVNTDSPIEITAETLEIDTERQQGTFQGKVVVIQDTLKLQADRLVVFYDASKTTNASFGEESFKRLEARGHVHVSSPDQVATGAWANYDLTAKMVRLGGGIVLTTGGNVLRGEELTIDLAKGVSRVNMPGGKPKGATPARREGERVRILIRPPAAEKKEHKGAKPKKR